MLSFSFGVLLPVHDISCLSAVDTLSPVNVHTLYKLHWHVALPSDVLCFITRLHPKHHALAHTVRQSASMIRFASTRHLYFYLYLVTVVEVDVLLKLGNVSVNLLFVIAGLFNLMLLQVCLLGAWRPESSTDSRRSEGTCVCCCCTRRRWRMGRWHAATTRRHYPLVQSEGAIQAILSCVDSPS